MILDTLGVEHPTDQQFAGALLLAGVAADIHIIRRFLVKLGGDDV